METNIPLLGLVFNQKSPVQPISESRVERYTQRTEVIMSNIGSYVLTLVILESGDWPYREINKYTRIACSAVQYEAPLSQR